LDLQLFWCFGYEIYHSHLTNLPPREAKTLQPTFQAFIGGLWGLLRTGLFSKHPLKLLRLSKPFPSTFQRFANEASKAAKDFLKNVSENQHLPAT
jgi:hypothetical protein